MASIKNKISSSPKKKTTIGSGIYTKKPHSGGETFYDGTRSSLSYDEISKQQNKKIDRSLQISSNNDNLGLDPRPFKVTKRRRSTIGAAYHHYAV